MSIKRNGKPTNSIKEIMIKARVDFLVKEKLEYCSKKMNCSKSEVIRLGIEKIYDEVNEVKK